jgi:hypothetical protein
MDKPSDSSTPNSMEVEHDKSAGRTDSVHAIPIIHTPDSTKSARSGPTKQMHPQVHTNSQEVDVSYMGTWVSDEEYIEPQETTEQGGTARSCIPAYYLHFTAP